MGFSFRKSIGLGPFRVNLSKGGVGLSTGVKGARISTGPSGTKVYGGWGPFRYQKNVAPGVGAIGPSSKKRGAWGLGTFVMLAVVVGVWAYTKYYAPPKPTKRATHSTPAQVDPSTGSAAAPAATKPHKSTKKKKTASS